MNNTHDQLPPCQGLAGRIFGHAFRPRFEYGPSPIADFSGKGMSPREVAGIMNAGREERYLGDRCARCGLFVSRHEVAEEVRDEDG